MATSLCGARPAPGGARLAPAHDQRGTEGPVMRGPESGGARADHWPATSEILRRPRAMTEPGLALVRHTRPERPQGPAGAAPYPGPSRHHRPHDAVAGRAGTPSRGEGPIGHAVLFYRAGAEVAGQVSAYLFEALREGGVAIVIATPARRNAIARALARAGLDVPAAETAGALVLRDARQTMDRFMIADWPSPASFWQVLSPLVRNATDTGKPVHVYGEMVALLWDAGLVDSAIEVEAMWNELAAQYPFSLLCAYPADRVRDEAFQDALAEVCRIHGTVCGELPGHAGRG